MKDETISKAPDYLGQPRDDAGRFMPGSQFKRSRGSSGSRKRSSRSNGRNLGARNNRRMALGPIPVKTPAPGTRPGAGFLVRV